MSGSAESGLPVTCSQRSAARKPLALGVDLLVEPGPQCGELAGGELVVEVRHVDERLLEELRAVEVAERVGREVPQRGHRPVDVLQAAAAVVGHLEAEVAPVLLVPGVRDVVDRERAVHDGPLDLEADHDVHVVGGLVGLDADEVGLDDVGAAVDVLE